MAFLSFKRKTDQNDVKPRIRTNKELNHAIAVANNDFNKIKAKCETIQSLNNIQMEYNDGLLAISENVQTQLEQVEQEQKLLDKKENRLVAVIGCGLLFSSSMIIATSGFVDKILNFAKLSFYHVVTLLGFGLLFGSVFSIKLHSDYFSNFQNKYSTLKNKLQESIDCINKTLNDNIDSIKDEINDE